MKLCAVHTTSLPTVIPSGRIYWCSFLWLLGIEYLFLFCYTCVQKKIYLHVDFSTVMWIQTTQDSIITGTRGLVLDFSNCIISVMLYFVLSYASIKCKKISTKIHQKFNDSHLLFDIEVDKCSFASIFWNVISIQWSCGDMLNWFFSCEFTVVHQTMCCLKYEKDV